MLIVTSNDIPGHRIEAVFGEVMGLTVRSRDVGAQVVAGLRALAGGELRELTQVLYESRQEVMARMVAEAAERGANAIVAMRFDTAHMANNWSEICAYGTAVFAVPLGGGDAGSTRQSAQLARTPSDGGPVPAGAQEPRRREVCPE
jgi:uncharacterized protein YbjQ (UPF0145 family)